MQRINFHRIFIIAGIVSLLVSYLVVWIRLINDPVERTGSDFIAFYTAGRIAQEEGASRVYDITLQRQVEEEQVGFVLAPGQVLQYNHLPFLIPILQFIVTPNYVASFHRWALFMAMIYAIGIAMLGRTLKGSGTDHASIRIATSGALLFLPLFFSLMNGQDTGILLLGTAVWVYGLLTGREWVAGLGLSLTTVRPHIALVLALPMLFRHYRVFLGFVIGSGILALFSLAILGLDGAQEFVDVILVSAGGDWYGIKQNVMFNLIGLLRRTLPWVETDTIRVIGWVIYGATILALVFIWHRTKGRKEYLVGLTVTLAGLVVPHLHFHDLTLILVPVFMLVRSSPIGWIKAPFASTLPLAISLLLLASNAASFLQFTVPYLISFSLIGCFSSMIFVTQPILRKS
jgi:hypothetical protein